MDGAPGFELYGYWRTSAAYRVRVALALKGLEATEHVVDLDAGENRGAAFLKISPLGVVPALVPRGAPAITQSLAILEYLDEVAPAPPLLPLDPAGRARVRSIAAMLAADTHPLITARIRRYLTATGGFDDAAWRAWQVHWSTTGLQAVEQRLAAEPQTGTFCHGDHVTIADICLVSITAMLKLFKIAVPGIPTVDRIVARCESTDAFMRADPSRQAGAPPS